ncbi:MAG: MarR family winged helix-turn-helix transcriptional regulator, partial [Allosphingosinicella sp.]
MLSKSSAAAVVEPVDLSDVGEIRDILGFHIRLAHVACYRHFIETFSDLELTQKQVSVLWLIGDNAGLSQTDLAQRLRMDRATTMGVVNRLQDRGFVRQGPSATDRRRKTLSLSPAGEKMLGLARAAIAEDENWLRGRYSEREV